MYGNTSLLYESPKNCVHTQSVYKASPQGGGAGSGLITQVHMMLLLRLVKVSFKVNVDEWVHVCSGEPTRVFKISWTYLRLLLCCTIYTS